MHTSRWTFLTSIIALTGILSIAVAVFADPPVESKAEVNSTEKSGIPDDLDGDKRVPVEVARKRAKLTHNIFSSTLDVIHHRYFRADRSSVPARALEDVFADLARKENIKANWIAVNSRAMSIDHEPEEGFEKQAAKAISAGKRDYESVDGGLYRRAERISLMNGGCLGCHLGFGATGTKKRFAGLVITIPVEQD